MAQREWFEYVNPDTGMKEFECPALQGQLMLSQIVSRKTSLAGDGNFGNTILWAMLCADARGHRVLPKGVKRTTNTNEFVESLSDAIEAGCLFDFADRYTVVSKSEAVDDGNADVDENPTGTSPESL